MVSVKFRYTEKDYARGVRAHYASVLRFKTDLVVSFTAGLLGAYFLRSPDSRTYGILFISLSAVLALMLVAAFAIIPSVMFRREPKLHDEYSLIFSPDGIHFRTDHIDSHLEWSLYTRVLVDAYSYVLYYGKRSFTVIPKRVFETADQRVAFEQLISQKIPPQAQKR